MDAGHRDEVLRRNDVRVSGPADAPVMILGRGFGCDQQMWRSFVRNASEAVLVGPSARSITGHTPNRIAPDETYEAIRTHLAR